MSIGKNMRKFNQNDVINTKIRLVYTTCKYCDVDIYDIIGIKISVEKYSNHEEK